MFLNVIKFIAYNKSPHCVDEFHQALRIHGKLCIRKVLAKPLKKNTYHKTSMCIDLVSYYQQYN